MFLKTLKIEDSGALIRDIYFHKGVNLIIDETKTADKKESGNNVGKTTVIRLVDYCLGGDGANIYKDNEFKQKSNTQIEEFLKSHNVIITLVLKEDLDIKHSQEITIRRNFLSRREKIQEINGTQYTNEEFPKKLKELIFDSVSEKPTFRQIIAKNIRDEKNRLSNTIKVLNPFTSDDVYESLYLFWLGIELNVNDEKQRLLKEKNIESNLQSRLRHEHSLSQIEQSLLVINRNIQELEQKKNNLSLQEKYKQEISKLNEIKFTINQIATELSRLEFRKELILESKSELENEVSEIDTNQLKNLYKEAKVLLPELHKTFSETLTFHNQMVNEKMKFITEELPNLENEIHELKRKRDILLKDESDLTRKLQKAGVFQDIEKIIVELNTAYEKKGNFEELKRMWLNSEAKLEKINKELEEINSGIRSKDMIIQKRVSEFNKFFSEMSYRLYGERFILSADMNDKGYELNISSISGNLGTGKKKGQIAAFDFAYIQFADAYNIKCLHFILHDQIENVHDNQINVLIDIANDVNCQYVMPILRDKLPEDIDIKQYEIISLAQDDKLFKVD